MQQHSEKNPNITRDVAIG